MGKYLLTTQGLLDLKKQNVSNLFQNQYWPTKKSVSLFAQNNLPGLIPFIQTHVPIEVIKSTKVND